MKAAIARTISSALTSATLRSMRRATAAIPRRVFGRAAEVHYFHQAGDPYSHLTAQALAALAMRYAIKLTVHLVPRPDDAAAPERGRLEAWSMRDAGTLARRLGLDWPDAPVAPDDEATRLADMALSRAFDDGDYARAVAVGSALWRGDRAALAQLATKGSAAVARAALAQGDALRRKLGHYLGGTFRFESEWFWGLDRLHYLETRLRALGLRTAPGDAAIAPVRDIELKAVPRNGAVPDLHFFYSFRSPYVYLSVPRVRKLAAHYGAKLHLRFILPMVMRGLPVPVSKQLYIVRDAKREAERVGMRFGRIADPVGVATERGYCVLNRAIAAGKGEDFSLSFLQGVFADGIDASTDRGLNKIAKRVGLDAAFVADALTDQSWRPYAEANRRELFELGLWGAPTLRVDNRPAHWGQDRLWAVENDLIAATDASP